MTAQPSYAPPPPPAPPPSVLPLWARWLGLGCGALLLLAAVAGTGFTVFLQKATPGPQQTTQAFLAAAGTGDFATAHSYFSERLKEVQPLEQFARQAEAHQQLFQVKDTTFNSRSVDLRGATGTRSRGASREGGGRPRTPRGPAPHAAPLSDGVDGGGGAAPPPPPQPRSRGGGGEAAPGGFGA